MKIIRAKGPRMVDYIQPHLLQDDEQDPELYCDQLRMVLARDPSCVRVLGAFNENSKGVAEIMPSSSACYSRTATPSGSTRHGLIQPQRPTGSWTQCSS